MAEFGLRSHIENLNMQLERGIYQEPILSSTMIAREAVRLLRNTDRVNRFLAALQIEHLNNKLQEGIYG